MPVVYDAKRKVSASVLACKHCGAQVYWGHSQRGKRVKLAVDRDGEQLIATTDVHDQQACDVYRMLRAQEQANA